MCTPVTQTVAVHGEASPHATSNQAAAQQQPLQGIETRLGRIENLLTAVLSNDTSSSRKRRRSALESPEDYTRDASSAAISEHIQVLMEDVAMGHRNKLFKEQGLHIPGNTPGEGALNQRSSDSPLDVAFSFLHLCPNTEQASYIIEHYFGYVDWMTRVLHAEAARTSLLRLAATPASEAVSQFPPSTICLYFIIIALGLHFASQPLLQVLNMDSKRALKLADTMFSGCQQLLWASDFLSTHQVEILSCVVLMSVYQHDRKDQADAFWALLGAAIKIGQNLGLCRLRDNGSIECELAKRTWWNLVWHDWSHAAAHYGCYAVHPSHNTTPYPHNVDVRGDLVIEQPLQLYTESTFTIFRLRYLEIYRQIVDARNKEGGPLDPGQAAELADALEDVHDSIPPCLSYTHLPLSEPPSQSMERAMLELIFQNRLLRLYRDRQLAGYHRAEWRGHREACVAAAMAIVQVAEREIARNPPLIQFWLVVFYLLGASTTLVMEICHSKATSQELSPERNAVQRAINLLSHAGASSQAARNSRRVLRELLAAEESVRSVVGHPEFASRLADASLDAQGMGILNVFHEILQKASGHSATEPAPSEPTDSGWQDPALINVDSVGNDAIMQLLSMTFGQVE